MHQHPVPGFVFRRPGLGGLLIPLLGPLKYRVNVDNHAPVIEQPVFDKLADTEFRGLRCHLG